MILAFVLTQDDGGGEQTAGTGGEVFLQAADDPGPDPFGPSIAEPPPSSTIAPDSPVTFPNGGTAPVLRGGGTGDTGGAITVTARSGDTPGLYGGTQDQASCNKAQMIEFLRANPDKAQAWAGVQGIPVSEIESYINGLIAVRLRGDTRVTNHGFKDGHAYPLQSILEEKTAVLVDNRGVPRARCACGNPLLAPVALSGPPDYKGTPWPGFNPSNITVINNSTTVINIITIIDVRTGTPFGRPTGPTGPDVTLPPGTSTTLPGPTSTVPGPTSTLPATGEFRLTNVAPSNPDPKFWTFDANAGTAHIGEAGGPYYGDYQWTVPQVIDPAGTTLEWGGTSVGNLAVDINVYGDGGVVFNEPDANKRAVHAYTVTGASGSNQGVITVPSDVTKFTLKFGMGFGFEVVYTYER